MQGNRTRLPSRDSSFNYGKYLASREWGLLKRAVRLRCHGVCENCHRRPYEETHHVSYKRLGNETVDDLMGVCRPCHRYLGGYTDVNPATLCCTPDDARDWLDGLIEADEPEHIIKAAERHLAEIEDAWN